MAKKIGHTSAAPPFIWKLGEGLAPRIVKSFSPKFFGDSFRPISLCSPIVRRLQPPTK